VNIAQNNQHITELTNKFKAQNKAFTGPNKAWVCAPLLFWLAFQFRKGMVLNAFHPGVYFLLPA